MSFLLACRQATRCRNFPRFSSSSAPNVAKKKRQPKKKLATQSGPAWPPPAADLPSAPPSSSARAPFTILPPIERSPVDLLQALADTVGEDPTGSHYSFVDDPALTPSSRRSHVRCFMAKEMGKRTARKLVEEWPSLFAFDRDIPYLVAFRPVKPLDPAVVVANEENLATMIRNRQVVDAKELYQRMEKAGEERCSTQTAVALFHLLCYYNEHDPPVEEAEWPGLRTLTDELEPSSRGGVRKHRASAKGTDSGGGLIDQLFDKLEKTPEVYSTMICNLCKFASTSPDDPSLKRAEELLSEMVGKGMQPSEQVFEYLLKSAAIRGERKGKAMMGVAQKLGVRQSVEMFNAQLGNLHIGHKS